MIELEQAGPITKDPRWTRFTDDLCKRYGFRRADMHDVHDRLVGHILIPNDAVIKKGAVDAAWAELIEWTNGKPFITRRSKDNVLSFIVVEHAVR